jgi:cell wall-associated NlpC family hydrolase
MLPALAQQAPGAATTPTLPAPTDAAPAAPSASAPVKPGQPSATAVVLDAPAASAPAGPAIPKLSERIQTILYKAITLLGTPYRWGGTSPESGFDCSGLVGYVFRTTLGVDLPRVSRQMARVGQAVDRAALTPGDLVFFGKRGRVEHVGIYVGEDRFLHAPSRGKDVRVDRLDNHYWAVRYMEGRRVEM